MSANDDGESDSGNDGGPGRRETAQRLFAAEFEDATFSYSESEEERAPNYVVAPSGARVNRLFAVGVLTETEPVSENVLRGRVVDPTGAFVTYAGQYQPDALAFLERVDPPAFVAVTGKARTFQPEDSDVIYTSVRPESFNEVDAETRDRWVVNAAERTRERVEAMRDAKRRPERGDDLEAALRADGVPETLAAGIPRALDAYDTTDDYLDALEELASDAVRVVAGEREEAGELALAPGDGENREPEPSARIEEETDERESKLGDPVGTEESAGQLSAPEPAGEPGETAETEAAETGEFDEPAAENVETGADEPASENVETGADESSDTGGFSVGTDDSDADAGEPSDAVDSEPTNEPESSARIEEEADERESKIGDPVGTEESAGQPSTPEPAEEPGETAETEATETGESDEPVAENVETGADEPASENVETGADEPASENVETGADEPASESADSNVDESAETDELYEFDDEERQQVEEEHGLEFSTGDEVESADELGDFQSGLDDIAETSDDGKADDAESEPAESEVTDETADTDESESAGFDDAEDAAVEAMQDLGDGDGVERDELVATMVERYGMAESEADDAVEEALMSGRCYESGDDELTPI